MLAVENRDGPVLANKFYPDTFRHPNMLVWVAGCSLGASVCLSDLVVLSSTFGLKSTDY